MKHFLLLCNRPAKGANADTIADHIDALAHMPGWQVWEMDMLGEIPAHLDLNRFDAIGIHYTLHLSDPNDHFLGHRSMERLRHFEGLKCIWLHDEYRRVNKVANILSFLKIDVIFSLASGDALNALYPKTCLPKTRLETVLAGYLPPLKKRYSENKPLSLRETDVGYRARRPPYWLGTLGQEKITIALDFLQRPEARAVSCDISVEETDRLYGHHWTHFLENTKTVLCVESGSSIIDFSGELEENVEDYCRKNPAAPFEDVYHRFLAKLDNTLKINPVSPRVFEAAAAGTVMVAFTGEYSGLLKPWVNYIPLEKDFSNIQDVVDAINTIPLLEKIAQQAWIDLVENNALTYSSFSQECAKILDDEHTKRIHKVTHPYTKKAFTIDSLKSLRYVYFKYVGKTLQKALAIASVRKVLFTVWEMLPHPLQKAIKPALKLIAR